MIALTGMLDLETSAALVFLVGANGGVALLLDVLDICKISLDATHHHRVLPRSLLQHGLYCEVVSMSCESSNASSYLE
jgi:hypothetical protein